MVIDKKWRRPLAAISDLIDSGTELTRYFKIYMRRYCTTTMINFGNHLGVVYLELIDVN